MKRYLLVSYLFITSSQLLNAQATNSFPATGDASIGSSNYLLHGDRIYYQAVNTVENNNTRGTIANNLYWNNTEKNWYTSTGTSNDFALIRFETGGGLSFYTRPKVGGTQLPNIFSNADLDNYKRLFIKNNGWIGFGTSSPEEVFDFNERTLRLVNKALLTDFSSTAQSFINFGNYATNNDPDNASNAGALYGIKLSSNFNNPSATALSKSSVVYGLVSEDQTSGYSKATGAVIYTSDINQNAVERFRITSKGNIGIGTTTPVGKLEIGGTATLNNLYDPAKAAIKISSGGNMIMDGNEIYSDGQLQIGVEPSRSFSVGFVDAVTAFSPAIRLNNTGNVGIGTTSTPHKLTVNGNIWTNGQMLIGSTIDVSKTTGYALAVNGSALFVKAVVKPYSSWPDYVFEPGYELQPLAAVESFIVQNKHLPDVPSASEINNNGIDIGENQTLLLKKTEELTLYIIEQDKTIKVQQEQLLLLEERLRKLEQLTQSFDK